MIENPENKRKRSKPEEIPATIQEYFDAVVEEVAFQLESRGKSATEENIVAFIEKSAELERSNDLQKGSRNLKYLMSLSARRLYSKQKRTRDK